MAHGAALLFELIASDKASPAFLRVAGAADKTAASTMRAQRNVAGSSALMARSGARLTKALTLPLLAVTAIGAKQAIEYQKQQALLRTAAGESEANMRQIAGGIKKVSSDTATSLHQLYEGMYVVAKAAKSRGWTGAEQLTILKAAAQGAKAENVDLAVATDALTTVMVDYHAKAGDSVKIENQLIKASGLAKTNYNLFSESLSNVTPIAAAAGLSVAEVTGSLATMTQHGVTAQRATENLRFLIFALSGQNNVASQSMQQLGIDTVDLAKNLGKRGLTGTLAIVDQALKSHTKNGMVTVDIHKAAALATKSLDTMLGSMNGKLHDQSKGLLSGKVGIKDYTMYAKSLGGASGASALQFLALTKNALGFSNQLKSGKGTFTTSLQQYQKMLGGMPGAAVAMQIAGKYAKDNVKNVKAVGDAAEHTGKNVHGWELTQKTLSYKLQDAGNKASLFATALGEKALPILGKIADAGTKAFKWIDGLSSTQKQFVGWGLGIALAIGPALSIIGRLGRAGTGFATFAGASEAAATRVGLAMQRIGAALGGLALVYGGTQVKGTGGAIMGALGGGMTGAAIGSFFGPIGTAVGGVVGAVGGLAAHFLTAGDSADKAGERAAAALAMQKKLADDLTASLQASAGAYDDQYKASVSSKLQSMDLKLPGTKQTLKNQNALALTKSLGLDPSVAVQAAIGDQAAIASIIAKQTYYKTHPDKITTDPKTGLQQQGTANAVKLSDATMLLAALKQLNPALLTAQTNSTLAAQSLGKTLTPADALAKGVRGLGSAYSGYIKTLDAATPVGQRNTTVLQEFGKQAQAVATKSLGGGKGIVSVAKAYSKSITGISSQMLKLGFKQPAIDKILAPFKKLPATVTQAGSVTKRELDKLSKLRVTPKIKADPTQASAVVDRAKFALSQLQGGKVIGIKADSRQAVAEAKRLQRIIFLLTGKTVPLDADPNPAKRGKRDAQNSVDSFHGKTVPIGVDPGPAQSGMSTLLASLSGRSVSVRVNTVPGSTGALPKPGTSYGTPTGKKHQPANGMILNWFARGGINKPGKEDHIAQIAKAGDWRVWAEDETGGEAYIPLARSKRSRSRRIAERTVQLLGGVAMFKDGGITKQGDSWVYDGTKYASKRAAENAKNRASKSGKKQKQDTLSSSVSSAFSGVGQASSPRFSLGDGVSFARLGSTLRTAFGKLQSAINDGLNKKAAGKFRSQLASLVKLANRQLSALRVKIKTSDMKSLRAGLKSSVDDARTALSTLYTDLKNSGVGAGIQAVIKKAGSGLITMRAALDKANEKLSTMKDYASGVGETLRSAFDPTKSGSVSDLLTGFSTATGDNKKFSSQVTGLLNRSKGDKTLTAFITQLAESGNTATLDTLAGSSKNDLLNVSKAVAGYNSSITAGTNAVSVGKFGLTPAQQQKNADALNKRIAHQTDVIGQLVAILPNVRFDLNGKPIEAVADARVKRRIDALVHELRKG